MRPPDREPDAELRILTESIRELQSGAWRQGSWRLTRALDRLPTSRILFYEVSYQQGDRIESAELVAKISCDDRGARAIAALQQLRQAGFQAPAPYQVPQPYGYDAGDRVLVQRKAPGVPWAELLQHDEPSLPEASAHAAGWLLQLQRTPLNGQAETRREDLAMVAGCAQDLVVAFPEQASRLNPLTERLLSRLGAEAGSGVLSHGDYHPENVLLAPGTVTVVDLDGLSAREPAFDAGYALGQLLTMSWIWLGAFGPGARAGAVFWRRYQQDGGRAPWPRVALHAARGVLQCLYYELCALRNQRADLLEPWTRLVEELLLSEEPATLDRLSASP